MKGSRFFPHSNYIKKERGNNNELHRNSRIGVNSKLNHRVVSVGYNIKTKLVLVSTQIVVVSTLNFDLLLTLIK